MLVEEALLQPPLSTQQTLSCIVTDESGVCESFSL